MDSGLFDKFLKESKKRLNGKSDSEKVRVFIDWCLKNNYEEIVLRISSEEKGGWARNYILDFTTSRIIVTKKSFLTKFVDVGYVAGLAPYPYLVLLKDSNPSKIRSQATTSPEQLLKTQQSFYIWYSDIAEFVLRKGTETLVTNMFGRAIVSNFLSIKKTSGEDYNFTLPVNKNGTYEQIRFWMGVVLPSFCPPY
ncbi:MAG: hypothetical protein QOK81_06655 [Nitrososphaeraceae archaeon]|nr:hypothetical protein [Nitrososphaeraceae archaeon]